MNLKLDEALKLAKKKIKDGSPEAAKILYQNILAKFPANKKAKIGLKALLDSQPGKAQGFLDLQPDQQHNLIKLYNQGQLQEALNQSKSLLEQFPNSLLLHNISGAIYADLKQYDESIDSFKHALKIKPDYADAHNNIGNVLREIGELDAALDSFKQALKINPNLAYAHNNMGNVLQDKCELDAAINSYKQALKIKPDYAEAHNNMGVVYFDKGKLDAAIGSYKKAIKIKPDYAEAHNNIGNALRNKGELDAAIDSYKKTLKIKPDYAAANSQMLHQLQHICDFAAPGALEDASINLGIHTAAVSSFDTLSWADNPEQHLVRSKIWAAERCKQQPISLPAKPLKRPKCLNIGYISADFKIHPVAYLIARVFELHDRNKFKIFGYSILRTSRNSMRTRIINSFDVHRDIDDISYSQASEVIKTDKIDILIDLTGYTQSSQPAILAFKTAPIQINYLGYPGSMGASFIDYIIADPVIIPDAQRQFYSESVIYLPHTYQPNDNTRGIAETNTTRSDFGLPDNAFVFCCFNKNYKISSREFDIWMRLLSKVEDSVLWLLKSNKWANQNLCKEAESRGIDPTRLVFAEKLSQSEHLARHKHADLFVDTFNYNAHTTASDALWSGLPVVTKQGKQFAARVAASLLTAIGLPQLITQTEEEYEGLILELALDHERLSKIKTMLEENRLKEPLFDTERYTRNFEAGLNDAYDLFFNGKEAHDIWVEG